MFTQVSLKSLYERACASRKIKKNSLFASSLPESAEKNGTLTAIDLSLNFAGPMGCMAVVDVACSAQCLQTLNLRDNQLSNDFVEYLCKKLAEHPSLREIDLGKNPISHPGGKQLASFVNRNHKIQRLDVDGTLLNPALVQRINTRASLNKLECRDRKEGEAILLLRDMVSEDSKEDEAKRKEFGPLLVVLDLAASRYGLQDEP